MSDEAISKIKQLQLDYQHVFADEAGKRVLQDLSRLGFGKASTFHVDSREHARREGRREVFLHIDTMLSLNITELENRLKEREQDHG